MVWQTDAPISRFMPRCRCGVCRGTCRTPPPGAGPSWSTASFGDAAGTSPMELSALGEHLELCRSLSGRLFGLRCAAENVQGFVAARFVTTLVVLSLIIGVGSLAW